MKPTVFFLGLFCLFSISACTLEQEELIVGNDPPPDKTVEAIQRETFVHRSYIDILGRKPTEVELVSALEKLSTENFSTEARATHINTVLSHSDYFSHEVEKVMSICLEDQTSYDIARAKYILELVAQDPSNAAIKDQLLAEAQKLEDLQNTERDYRLGRINEKGVFRRCMNNYLYDQLNMGSENYAISVFKKLLQRAPTDAEKQAAVQMIDGFSSVLFLIEGKSKEEFLSIVLDSDHFFEGQTLQLFDLYLYRNPSSSEAHTYSKIYKESSLKELQKTILSTDEYAGL